MSYESAPATDLVKTRCACCGRALVDAASLAAGMGPDCRKRHGLPTTLTEAERTEANKIIHAIAEAPRDPDTEARVQRLKELGCEATAKRITSRLGRGWRRRRKSRRDANKPVYILTEGDTIIVDSPYSKRWVELARRIRGRRYLGDGKNRFPKTARAEVWDAIRACYAGRTLKVTGKPDKVIPARASAAERLGRPESTPSRPAPATPSRSPRPVSAAPSTPSEAPMAHVAEPEPEPAPEAPALSYAEQMALWARGEA